MQPACAGKRLTLQRELYWPGLRRRALSWRFVDIPYQQANGTRAPEPSATPLGITIAFATGPRAFGHFGAGGSLGFADPDARVAIGYAMNQGRPGWQYRHVRQLLDLVSAAL